MPESAQQIKLKEIQLIGLVLKTKTMNENGRSAIDCGNLWQQFEKGNYAEKIPGKLSNEIFAVYYNYEGDHTKPFSYFIGCKVKKDTEIPDGLNGLIIPEGIFEKIIAKGKMPDCVADSWKDIWSSNLPRAYNTDFEVYDERSKDWNDAVIEIFISVK